MCPGVGTEGGDRGEERDGGGDKGENRGDSGHAFGSLFKLNALFTVKNEASNLTD